MAPKFFRCKHCGNIVEMVFSSGVPIVCCGEPMKELVANTVDAAFEKHLPVVEVTDHHVKVKVGSVNHPMVPEHYIQWIYVETNQGIQRKHLRPGEEPIATFELADRESLVAVYEYCNLHGLWKTTL